MSRNILERWDGLGIDDIFSKIASEFAPTANRLFKEIREDGLVEITAEKHEGFSDDDPQKQMRFAFDGDNLMISMTVSEKPFLRLIDTRNLTKDTVGSSLRELIVRG